MAVDFGWEAAVAAAAAVAAVTAAGGVGCWVAIEVRTCTVTATARMSCTLRDKAVWK